MALPPPPPGFTLDAPGAGPAIPGRTIVRKGVEPTKPDLPEGWEIGPGGTARPVAGLPGAFTQPGPKQTPAQARKDELEVIKAERDLAKTPETDPALSKAIKGIGIDEWLTNVDRAREHINTGFATGMLGSIAGHFPGTPRKDFLGALQGIKGASILEKLQALREQSKTGASGMGSLTEQEGERLANSIASLSDDMSASELKKSLTIIERHAKSLKAIGDGLNPEDPAVQKKYGIPGLPGAEPAAADTPDAPPLNPLANNTPGDQGPQFTPSTGGTRSIVDPKKQALGEKIAALVAKGADRNTVMGFAVRADPTLRSDPVFRGWVDEALGYRKKYPGAKFSIDPGFYTQEVPLDASEQSRNTTAQSTGAALALNALDGATAGSVDKIIPNSEATLAAMQQQHPGASFAGQVGGGATAALGLEGLLAKLGMAPGLLRGALADATYGGAAGANSDSDMGAAGRIANGALFGLGGNVAGQGLLRIPGAALRGATSPATSYVAREVPGAMTIGQAVGGKLKGFEDRLSGLGLGVSERHLEGLQKMNSKAFDRALDPIGGKVDGKFGEEAVAHAQGEVSNAFSKALSGKSATTDHRFIVDSAKALNAMSALPPRVATEVEDSVNEVVRNYFDPATLAINGENLQSALRELGDIKRAYKNDPLGHRIGKSVDQMTDALENMFRRQAPDVMPQYEAAKKAFKRVSTLEDAVLRAKNESKDGNAVFTSGQLGMVDRANTVKFGGKHAAAAGKGEFHEFQRNVQEVLANKVPDSGSAGRILVPMTIASAIGGAGAGAPSGNAVEGAAGGAGTNLTLAGLLALAYTRTGQRVLTSRVLNRGVASRAAGRAAKKAAPALGHAAGTAAALGSRDE